MPVSDTRCSVAFDLPLEGLPPPLNLTSEIVKQVRNIFERRVPALNHTQDVALGIGRVVKVYRGVWTTKGIPVVIKHVEAVKRKADDKRVCPSPAHSRETPMSMPYHSSTSPGTRRLHTRTRISRPRHGLASKIIGKQKIRVKPTIFPRQC